MRRSAYNDCNLIHEILFSFHTPKAKASALVIEAHNPQLAHCRSYSNTLR